MATQRGRDVTVEVSWCRQLLERTEKEYASMVDSLISEQKQLEDLLGLMARHLDDLSTSFPGKELQGSSAAKAAGKISGQVALKLEELLRRKNDEMQDVRTEKANLQRKLREEEMTSRSLQRQLESSLEVAASVPQPPPRSEAEDKDDLLSRLQSVELARAEEAKCREMAELRCALIERRCRDTVSRLEAEIEEVRESSRQDGRCLRSGATSENGSSPAKPASIEARSPLRDEAARDAKHRAMYRQYASPESVAEESVAEELFATPPPLPGSKKQASTRTSFNATPSTGSSEASDDEDYAWQGYLERPCGMEGFEKVFVEVNGNQMRTLPARGAQDVLSTLPLSTLSGPAVQSAGGSRSFEVPLTASGPSTYRCVSEGRALQWIEAINRAWTRSTQKWETELMRRLP